MAFSPDGQSVVYHWSDGVGGHSLRTVGIDGLGDTVLLEEAAYTGSPDWALLPPNLTPGDHDGDGDGSPVRDDCDDGDATVYPGSFHEREGDGVDSNCDGDSDYYLHDAPNVRGLTWTAEEGAWVVRSFPDQDGDGVVDLLLGGEPVAAGGVYLVSSSALVEDSPAFLPSQALYRLDGEAPGDDAGSSALLVLGDWDGDGLPEIAVAARGHVGQGSSGGRVYIVPGSAFNASGSGGLLGASMATIDGQSGDLLSEHLELAGDYDGDGFPELMVGTPSSGGGIGRVYCFLSSVLAQGGTLLAQNAWLVIEGLASSDATTLPASLGDIDGDGWPELAVGYHEGVALFWGSVLAAGGTKTLDDGFLRLEAMPTGVTSFCTWPMPDIDLDGDGAVDLLLGCPGQSGVGGFVGYLATDIASQGPALSLSDAWLSIVGTQSGDRLGKDLVPFGDTGGDGLSEWIATAQNHNWPSHTNAGAVYIIPSSEWAGGGSMALEDVAVPIVELQTGNRFGSSKSTAAVGDLTGDGVPDAVFGHASWPSYPGSTWGRIYLVPGDGS